ncbi:GDP-mannose 4,6-dehydratase [Mycoplasmatota bacterium]|nr:GDP-mannose 4,6-dehydratase [Mycoplasmatota bacterium]
MEYKDLEFPKGTKFLVTGSAGFIGSNLVETILSLGYEVRGLDNLSTGYMKNMDEFQNNIRFEFIKGDIRDVNVCNQACRGIDYVLHQAALGSVPRSMREPLLYCENNIRGTSNMMEAARKNNVKRFIYASSSSVYGDSVNLPKKEGQEGQVISPYALSKKVNEEYGKIYTNVYGLPCIGLRYFNVFGPKQDAKGSYAAVIPMFIKQLINGEKSTINGDGSFSRDFTFIDNVIQANIISCLAGVEATGKVYNIAYGERRTILEIYNSIASEIKSGSNLLFGINREGDVPHSFADITNARNHLNYNPQYDFEKGIKISINWYRNNL